MDKGGIGQFVIDCSVGEDLDGILDDASWPTKLQKIGNLVKEGLTAACIIHPGNISTLTPGRAIRYMAASRMIMKSPR